MKHNACSMLLAVFVLCLSANGADRAQISKPETLDNFSWLTRKLVKEPAYKSEKVRYTLWALGDGKKSVMTMAWDESGGTGKGYDTFYFDTNFNGDLTEAAKCFDAKGGKTFEVAGVKEADGQRSFTFKFVPEGDNFNWQSGFSMAGPNGGYGVGLLPGNLKINWANSIKDAPVYHLGGPAVVHCQGKSAGESMGKWTSGTMVEVWTDVNLVGDEKSLLRFYHSHAPGEEPQIMLRVQDKIGATLEDIAFTGGCGCAGSFGKSLLIPSRVPPGTHSLVVRADRAPFVGGPAEFLYPVEIDNPDFGKPLIDPAFQALKANFPSAAIASLRRATGPGQDIKGYPEENVVPVQVSDDSLFGPTRDWDMSNVNQGGEPTLCLGPQIHHNVDARTLIKFDLSALSKDTKISGAQLRLTLSNQPYTGAQAGAKIDAYAVRQDWSETEACWNSAKKGAAWGAQGCNDPAKDRFAEPAGSVDIGGFPGKTERYRFVSIDLTELVKKWQSGELPNNGVLLKYSGGGCVKIHSSEFQDYPFRPALVLAYSGGAMKPAAVAADEDLDAARSAAKRLNKPLLVRFYSPTCAVCKGIQESTFADSTVKDALSKKFQYVSVKIEDHAALAQELGVGSVPTVVMLKSDGQTRLGLIESTTLKDKTQFLTALANPAK